MRVVVCTVAAVAVSMSLAVQAREMPLPRWDWVLSGPIDIEALNKRPLDYAGFDAFDTAAATVAAVRDAETRVWCYISVGTIEDWRPDYDAYMAADAAAIAAGGEPLIGAPYEEWPGEYWLNPRALDALMPLIETRLALCAEKGFDMVEFDNLDGFDNETGLAITADEEVAFARALAEAAERHGLAPILKNTPDLVDELVNWFAGYLMEDCVLSGTCASGAPFLAANKPVFNAEYPDAYDDAGVDFDLDAVCLAGEAAGVGMLIKPLDLTSETTLCP